MAETGEMRDFVPLPFLWFAKRWLEIAAPKSNYMGDLSIVLQYFPSLKGHNVSMQLSSAKSHEDRFGRMDTPVSFKQERVIKMFSEWQVCQCYPACP